MRFSTFLFFSDLFFANIGTLTTAGLALLGLVVWLVRLEATAKGLEATAKEMRKDVDEMHETVYNHVKDNNAHVNQLHIGNLERRISTLENSVRDIGKEIVAGNERISTKIDAKFDQLAAKMR